MKTVRFVAPVALALFSCSKSSTPTEVRYGSDCYASSSDIRGLLGDLGNSPLDNISASTVTKIEDEANSARVIVEDSSDNTQLKTGLRFYTDSQCKFQLTDVLLVSSMQAASSLPQDYYTVDPQAVGMRIHDYRPLKSLKEELRDKRSSRVDEFTLTEISAEKQKYLRGTVIVKRGHDEIELTPVDKEGKILESSARLKKLHE